MAFCDAIQLAQQLTDSRHATLQEAVAAYDAESGPRSRDAVLAGRRNMALVHTRGLQRLLILSGIWLVGSVVRARGLLLRLRRRFLGG